MRYHKGTHIVLIVCVSALHWVACVCKHVCSYSSYSLLAHTLTVCIAQLDQMSAAKQRIATLEKTVQDLSQDLLDKV